MSARALHGTLRGAIARRDAEEVQAMLDQLAEVDPDSVHTRCLALEWLIVERRVDEARRLAADVVARFPASARAHWLAGWASYVAKDYPSALDAFSESDRISSGPSIRRWVGRTLTNLGRFDEAEPILRAVGARARMDLAWLHERRGELRRALDEVERHLADHPDDVFARTRRESLVARRMSGAEAVEEVAALQELGEPVPASLGSEAFRAMLETGRTKEARRLADSELAGAAVAEITRWAWIAYRAETLDLACQLFERVLGTHAGNPKFLAALERAARASGRVAELVDAYRAHAPQHPRLWGRIKRHSRTD